MRKTSVDRLTDVGVGGVDEGRPEGEEARKGPSADTRELLEGAVGLPVVETESLVIRSSTEIEYAAR